MEFVDLKAQRARIESSLQKRMAKVLEAGQFIMGPEVEELEKVLASYTGSKHCITCANGTDALQIAMMALGIGPGHEVITTSFSFIATVETIVLLGATPVFVDVDPKTYNLDPSLIKSKITKRTRAIIPVGLYGQCSDMDRINAIANEYGLSVIEDAAQSFGATYSGKKSCNLSDIGCTSFFPSKPLGCYGDGGALFTNDDEIAAKLKAIRVHGASKRYFHNRLGVNSRLDTLQAAVLLAKMEVFPAEVEVRAKVGANYSKLFADVEAKGLLTTPKVFERNTHVYAQYTIEVNNREQVQAALKEKGIPTVVHYPMPLHMQPVFKDLRTADYQLPVSERAAKRVLSLPMHPYLTREDQEKVAEAVKHAVNS